VGVAEDDDVIEAFPADRANQPVAVQNTEMLTKPRDYCAAALASSA
jgi:hypothetical protein